MNWAQMLIQPKPKNYTTRPVVDPFRSGVNILARRFACWHFLSRACRHRYFQNYGRMIWWITLKLFNGQHIRASAAAILRGSVILLLIFTFIIIPFICFIFRSFFWNNLWIKRYRITCISHFSSMLVPTVMELSICYK